MSTRIPRVLAIFRCILGMFLGLDRSQNQTELYKIGFQSSELLPVMICSIPAGTVVEVGKRVGNHLDADHLLNCPSAIGPRLDEGTAKI